MVSTRTSPKQKKTPAKPPSVKEAGKVCDTCGLRKSYKSFLQIANTKPAKWASSCLACEAKANADALHVKNLARKLEKTTAEQRKKLVRKAARDRAKYQRAQKRVEQKQQLVTNQFERELARRELSRRYLLRYIQRFNPNYVAGWVHEDICRRLEQFVQDVEDGKNPRLMLFMPPRHGKSLIASQNFPAWVLGKHPEWEIIAASYAVSLPLGFSRAVRAQIRDPMYRATFPDTILDEENQAAEGWKTTEGGGYLPAGVGGGITGKGANILIIDDPIKDAEEADSETVRESNWNWYSSTAYTRLAPKSGVLIIQTRWHDDDLSGRAINQMREAIKLAEDLHADGLQQIAHLKGAEYEAALAELDEEVQAVRDEVDHWEIVSYPAIAEHDEWLTDDGKVVDFEVAKARLLRKKGEALHEERFPLRRLRKIRRTLLPRHWSALYQQNPVPEEGLYFKKEMLRFGGPIDWRELPIVMAWDLAVGQKQVNDYTVGVVGCIDYDDRVHVLEMVRGRMDTHQIVEAILDLYQRYKMRTTQSVVVGIEKGQLELAIRPQLKKRMKERRIYPSFDDELKPLTDKLVRARPLQGRMQQGMVVFPSNTTWVDTIVHEMLRFPGGIHDDTVDAMAWMVRMLERVGPPKLRQPKKLRSWRDRLKAEMSRPYKHPMAA